MSRTRFVSALMAASFITASGCSDATSPAPSPAITLPPTLITLVGVVHGGLDLKGSFTLATVDEEVRLTGAQTALLASIDNAEVEVRGGWDSDGSFEVSDFTVRRVDGVEAIDGILIAIFDRDDDPAPASYGLAQKRGPLVPLVDPPATLLDYVGQRVWIAGPTDAAPTAFGIIK